MLVVLPSSIVVQGCHSGIATKKKSVCFYLQAGVSPLQSYFRTRLECSSLMLWLPTYCASQQTLRAPWWHHQPEAWNGRMDPAFPCASHLLANLYLQKRLDPVQTEVAVTTAISLWEEVPTLQPRNLQHHNSLMLFGAGLVTNRNSPLCLNAFHQRVSAREWLAYSQCHESHSRDRRLAKVDAVARTPLSKNLDWDWTVALKQGSQL